MSTPLFEGHTRQIDAVTRHHIEWEFDRDSVKAKAVCESGPDADCHQTANCECESWHIERDDTSAVFHFALEYEDRTSEESQVRHPMHAVSDCNVCEWLNNGEIEELSRDRQSFLIARTSIESHWEDDHVTWSPAARAAEAYRAAKADRAEDATASEGEAG